MEVKPYKTGDYKALLKDIRPHDLEEIEALGIDAETGVKESIHNSDVLGVIWEGENMICIFGVTPTGVLSKKGVPWVVGTTNIKPRTVIECMPVIIKIMLGRYKVLTNFVYTRNKPSISMLKHAGFKFYPAQRVGIKGELFHRFELRG